MTSVTTSPTLLMRLKNQDDKKEWDQAWDRFYQLYPPLIIGYAYNKMYSRDMANEVLQETLITLMKTLSKFKYYDRAGSFRSYLRHIVNAKVADWYRRNKRFISTDIDGEESSLKIVEPCPVNHEVSWDEIWDQNLLHLALEKVRKGIDSTTWDSFELYVLREIPIGQVQQHLHDTYGINVKRNKIYQDKHRVIEMLKKEVTQLREEMGDL